MITFLGKKLTPKQAAKLIVEEGIGQNLTHWDSDTYSGEELARVMTQREWRLVNDQIKKIWSRIDKLLGQGERA